MHKNSLTYEDVLKRFHSLLMIVLLLWLTVSTPYVFETQQDVSVTQGMAEEDDASSPLSNTNEEKAEAGVGALSEYLHETHHYHSPSNFITSAYKCHPDDLYSAFHPELLSPPPERGV